MDPQKITAQHLFTMQALSDQRILLLNRYFTLHTSRQWAEAASRRRGERLLEIAGSVWPHPRKPADQ